MIAISNDARIFIFTGSTDMRKGFHGLISLVQKFSEDPIDGSLYVFTNRNRTRLKILYWDGDGFALWYKRLEKAKYKWPIKEQNEVFTLTKFELDRLLSGFTIIGHKPVQINDFTMT